MLVPGDLEDPAVPAEVVNSAADQLGRLDAFGDVTYGVGGLGHPRHHGGELRPPLRGQHQSHLAADAAFARHLPATGGSVVALTSDHTVRNLPYGVTKGGLDRLVLASAHELADAGVRANVINPGPIDTGWMTDEIRASGLAQQPTGRLGTPKDTANLVRFLLSKQGEWINGQLLYSNGGYPKGRLPV